MLEELERRSYSSETIRAYLFVAKDFATYFDKRPDLLHVLPKGFVRVRHFGVMANYQRSESMCGCDT
jgi:hypothetical protein